MIKENFVIFDSFQYKYFNLMDSVNKVDISVETDYKKSTQTSYFIAFLILRIILLLIHIPKEHTLRIAKC